MITINEETKKFVEELAAEYKIAVVWDMRQNAVFQEEVSKSKREMTIQGCIEPTAFDALFEQHKVDYPVKRDQEMFVFNALHGIGHFVKDLWVRKTDDETVNRLTNFDQDPVIDKWAYDELVKLKKAAIL